VSFLADVRKETEMAALAEFAETTAGGFDVLINNASAPRGGDNLSEWTDALETALLGAIHAAPHASQSR
jgi:NAD(P)-dependent dehydrogenase (short-subunit alcohol dehydrogenase family)